MSSPGAVLDPERRAALNAAKLAALVTAEFGEAERTRSRLGTGAGLVGDGRAWVLPEERGLGAALAWASRTGAGEVHVVAEEGAGDLARQAGAFTAPVTVWSVRDRALARAEPAPLPDPPAPPDAPEHVAMLHDAGLEVVVEGSHLAGEVLGLEVARIEHGPDGPTLSVGVGRFDRELTALLHAEEAPADALARVAAEVRRLRRPAAPPHPLRSLVPERWLRRVLVEQPGIVGCSELSAAPSPLPRAVLRSRGVCAATGLDTDGSPVVVAISVGVDLELVPVAADLRSYLDPGATLVLAVPERDVLAVTRALAGALTVPATIRTAPDGWRGG